jgi:hypothetical protein
MNDWTEADLQQLIDNEIEESVTLEYKGANALGKSDGKKKEITKVLAPDILSGAGTIGGFIFMAKFN